MSLRAGLLNARISILVQHKIQSPSGEVRDEYVEEHKIRAYRRKLTAAVGSGVNASEEFISNTLIFQTRQYSFLQDTIRILYEERQYKVVLIDSQRDNTYLITCSKIND